VLCLLKSLKEEAITQVRVIDLTKSSEDVKATAAMIKMQLNLTSTLIDLPEVIKTTRQQIEEKQRTVARMQAANEATGIHDAGGNQ
jgi:hypothetical protein